MSGIFRPIFYFLVRTRGILFSQRFFVEHIIPPERGLVA